ncbi:sugar phosphate isomerase/epimerase family protein [Lysobacter korlensis]|uniref:Sugar phosphate isomerase/epimerase family protein n=1 Tax=Lysobacter korlensis TaxID=553636 RepID=A0ABV6RZT2_9GAMM
MIGLSTYSFFWRWSERAPEPLTLPQMLTRTAELGVGLFQICDYPPIEDSSPAELAETAALARRLGVKLELGTKGIEPDHLRRYLAMTEPLGVSLLRSMLYSPTSRPSIDDAKRMLTEVVPEFEAAGVQLALETYEQVRSADLVDVVTSVGSPVLGICLDPGNCVANLEHPRDVVERTAPYVLNLHVKEFAFSRRGGWVGFLYAGAPLGQGLLDYDHLVETTQAREKGLSQVIEHWLPWQDDYAETARLEDEWTVSNLEYLRSKNP